MCTDVCHDRVSVIITITLFLLLPVSTAVATSSQNPLFPVEFPVGFWIGLIERQEWGVQPSKCIKSCERAQGRRARRGSGSGEREGKKSHAGSGSGLRPAAFVPRESSISTHIHTACCCPLTGLLTLPTSSTRSLIDPYRITRKRMTLSTGYCHLFFFL